MPVHSADTVSSASKANETGLGTYRRQTSPHSKWCGHPKSHLDHCCFMRKGLEFVPQQMPGPQSQLGGLVGIIGGKGRKTRWKVIRVGLELQALSQRHHCYTTQTPLLHYTDTTATLHRHHCYTTQTPLLHYTDTTATLHRHHCYTTQTPLLHYTDTTATLHRHHCYTTQTPLLHYTDTTATLHRHHTHLLTLCYSYLNIVADLSNYTRGGGEGEGKKENFHLEWEIPGPPSLYETPLGYNY